MATVRTPKGTPLKKGPDSGQSNPSPARRAPAWTNRGPASPGPAYNAAVANPRAATNGFPPLAGQTNGKSPQNAWGTTEDKERLLASLAGSINSVITVSLRSNTRIEGILTTVSPSATDDASLTLKNAKDLSMPSSPPKDTFKIPASNVLSFTPGPASGASAPNKPNESFRTDTEISRTTPKRERELQAWQPDAPETTPATNGAGPANAGGLHRTDDVTFGPGASATGSWDQFAANERLFGVRTHFDEDEYTTKLDRSAKDFKERERRAEQIAAEIIGSTTNNPHIAEERNLVVDDSGINEEDKYGAVVRGPNAYIPPARRQNSTTTTPAPVATPTPKEKEGEVTDKQEKSETPVPVPTVSVNAPDGTEKTLPRAAPTAAATGATKPPADALPAFRDFVTNERQRLTQKKQALVRNEMEKRVADLVKFSQSFKLNKPIPDDLVPILAKDEEKQRKIKEKSAVDAQSAQARAIGVSSSIINNAQKSPPTAAASKPEITRKPSDGSAPGKTPMVPASKSSNAVASSAGVTASGSGATGSSKMETSKTVPRMVIQAIPPFRGKKSSASTEGKPAESSSPQQPLSPTFAQRLNVNASSFRPNPKAAAFTPVTNGQSTQKAKDITPSAPPTPNPFFGTSIIKKGPPVNVKDDFNPFKHAKVAEASTIGDRWPYNGKRYMQLFPPPPPTAPQPQASPHLAPHGPPPPPPPSYDEDAAAQQAAAAAAARGYAVYAYAPYYPGQPLMPGMPGVPPGAFVPAPYMQPMPYPPNMPPPTGQPMYAPPPMGQMPPPQQYMQPPPPGAYPPPPTGAAPRPSMPPTPIPSHAHPYYQSPQLQHAVPYPMMIPPPGPTGPPHHYEGGPPVPPIPMGGVGHA